MDPGFIWKELPTGFADALDVGCEIPRGGKKDSKTFGLKNWKDGVTFYRYEETGGGACCGDDENQEFDSGYFHLNMPKSYIPVEMSSRQLAMQFWNLGERSSPETQFGSRQQMHVIQS